MQKSHTRPPFRSAGLRVPSYHVAKSFLVANATSSSRSSSWTLTQVPPTIHPSLYKHHRIREKQGRELGQLQINQMKKGDPRVPQFFRELRSAMDLLEDMILHPHVEAEQKVVPPVRTAPPVVIERLPEKIACSIKVVRTLTGISNATIYKEIKLGRLRPSKSGGRTLILAKDLQTWIDGWQR